MEMMAAYPEPSVIFHARIPLPVRKTKDDLFAEKRLINRNSFDRNATDI
jgi:hypothetical protein